MSPERPPRVQALATGSVLELSGYLVDLATRVTALLGDPVPVFPADIPLGADADRARIERNVRAAAARFGEGEARQAGRRRWDDDGDLGYRG